MPAKQTFPIASAARLDLQHRGELGDEFETLIARALLQLAQIGAVDAYRGCSRGAVSGSRRLICRQAQP